MDNEINSPYHWRIMRRAETDLGSMYTRNIDTQTTNGFVTRQYCKLLYYLMMNEHAIGQLNWRYKRIVMMTTIWHSEKDQKYVKFDSIWMWVNAMANYNYVHMPHKIRIKIIKRINKFINDKRTKLYIPVDKRSISSEKI